MRFFRRNTDTAARRINAANRRLGYTTPLTPTDITTNAQALIAAGLPLAEVKELATVRGGVWRTAEDRCERFRVLADAGMPLRVAWVEADWSCDLTDLLPFEDLLVDPSPVYPDETQT